MKVNELKDKSPVPELVLKIISKEEPRDIKGGAMKVCNATGEDDTGAVTVTLWNEDVDKVQEGDTIRITKGWATTYQDKLQVSAGKFGKLEIVGK